MIATGSDGTVGIAMLGSGFISFFHYLAGHRVNGVRWRAIASRSRNAADQRALLFGLDGYGFDQLDEIWERQDVDAVAVLSPNHLHATHGGQAVRAGKHVIMEKPLAVRLGEGRDLVDAAKRHHLQIGYAENHAFAPLTIKAMQHVQAGDIGNLREIRCLFGHGGPPEGAWQWDIATAGGGAQLDLGSHVVATSLHMAGQPRIAQVTRARITARRAGEVDSYALSEGVSEDDIRFVWECSWGMPDGLARYDLIGDGGSLRINLIPSPFGSNLIRKDRAGNETTLDAGIAPAELRASHFLSEVGYVNQLQEFRDAFASNRRPRVDAELGYHTLQVLAAGYLSARTERAVAVDDRLPSDQLLGEL